MRQRLRIRSFASAELALGALLVVAALALIWYGAMTILLAIKVRPGTVESISAYHTIYGRLTTITASDFTGTVRGITAGAGVACFLVCSLLVWRSLPRPYLARRDFELDGARGRGTTVVAPRAIERAAEIAALEHPLVTEAAGRYQTEDLHVAVSVRRAAGLEDTLEAVRSRVLAGLVEHELPRLPVNVTLTGFERTNRRELH